MTGSSGSPEDLLSRFLSAVEARSSGVPPVPSTVGCVLLGAAMLAHVALQGRELTSPPRLTYGVPGTVTLSPPATAVLVSVGMGLVAVAVWTRLRPREPRSLVVTVGATLVGLGHLLALRVFTQAEDVYPIVHVYRVGMLATALLVGALGVYLRRLR